MHAATFVIGIRAPLGDDGLEATAAMGAPGWPSLTSAVIVAATTCPSCDTCGEGDVPELAATADELGVEC